MHPFAQQLKSITDTSNFEEFPEELDEDDDEHAQETTLAGRRKNPNRENRPQRKKDPRFIGYTYRNARFGTFFSNV